VRGNIVPVPIRQIGEIQGSVVAASRAAVRRTKAVDDNGFEARIAVDRTVPVGESTHGFPTPGHGALKRSRDAWANHSISWDRNRGGLLPVAAHLFFSNGGNRLWVRQGPSVLV
jgi:hypothetical protein